MAPPKSTWLPKTISRISQFGALYGDAVQPLMCPLIPSFTIPSTRCRHKTSEKWTWSHWGKWGKWPKMRKVAWNWLQNETWAIFPCLSHFSPYFHSEAKIHFLAIPQVTTLGPLCTRECDWASHIHTQVGVLNCPVLVLTTPLKATGECPNPPVATPGVAERAPWRSTKRGAAGVSSLSWMPTDSCHFPLTSNTLVRPQYSLARKALQLPVGLQRRVRHSPEQAWNTKNEKRDRGHDSQPRPRLHLNPQPQGGTKLTST